MRVRISKRLSKRRCADTSGVDTSGGKDNEAGNEEEAGAAIYHDAAGAATATMRIFKTKNQNRNFKYDKAICFSYFGR